MPDIYSTLRMQGARVRNLQAPVNSDEPARKADIDVGKRIYKNNLASGAITIDWSLYDEVRLTLVGDVVLTFSGALDGQGCIIKLKQDSFGDHSVTLPANIRYSIDMRSYSMTAGAYKVDRVGFMYDADDTKYDFISTVRNLT